MIAVTQPLPSEFCSEQLEQLFNVCFAAAYRTCLSGGAQEPLYQPAQSPTELHRLYYRQDFFASALHEISHWCIAGSERRKHLDFGYWYAPDGRTAKQQAAFEQVEAAPQALEYFFARACGFVFRVSIDNLEAGPVSPEGSAPFREAIYHHCGELQRLGLAPRAKRFYGELSRHFGICQDPAQLVIHRSDFDQ